MNADDFGLTRGVCAGILRAHRDGVVTSTSVLTPAPAFRNAAASLRDSGLAAGLHLCVVGEDPPLLSAREVPTLVDGRGRLPLYWQQVVRRSLGGRLDPADVEREFDAQAECFAGEGLVATHVDSHQNLHLWPPIGRALMAVARRRSIRVMRVARTNRRAPVPLGVRCLSRVVARRGRAAGFVVPDAAVGLDTAGGMCGPQLHAALASVREVDGHVDMTVHPGEAIDPERSRYRWGYSWEDELRSLLDPDLRAHIARSGLKLGTFADLERAAEPAGGVATIDER